MPMTLNPSIKTLILKYNDFHSVDASFHFYPELQLVDLSSNQLVSVPDRAFTSQRKLIELRLGGNKVSQLTDSTFSGLARLQSLDLKHNFLERLDNRVFKPLKALKELNLESNRISEIAPRAFIGCSEIRILKLNDNLLAAVPTQALHHLAHLAELQLARNSLTVIADFSFPLLHSLSILDLSGNTIEKVHEKGFSEVRTVRTLDLHDNHLHQLPTDALRTFHKLEELNIGQNKFTVIESGALRGLSKLRRLEVSGCQDLVEVAEDAFTDNYDLETVKISSNRKLAFIHPSSIGPLTGLKNLDLSNNALTKVSPSLVPWMSLTSVDLSGNPWTCDCENSFLRSVIINSVNHSESVRVVRCWNPPSLRDEDLAYLSMDCQVIHSPNTDQAARAAEGAGILAVVLSVVVVALVLLSASLVVVSRKRVKGCLQQWQGEASGRVPVSSKEILQYPDDQEPRYVSHCQGSHTLRGQGSPVIRVNPGFQQQAASLVRHDQYFLTLARQQGARRLYQDSNYAIDPVTEQIYQVAPSQMIYQAVSDTQSEPISEI